LVLEICKEDGWEMKNDNYLNNRNLKRRYRKWLIEIKQESI